MMSTTALVFFLAVATALLGCHGAALPTEPTMSTNKTKQAPIPRSENTCADPSLAKVLFRGFAPSTVAHIINVHWAFEQANTVNAAALFISVDPVFRAWTSQQPFTVPLFGLATSDRSDYIYAVGPDAQTPPNIPGFNTGVYIAAWVYDTPICGSVPLMSAAYSAETDHYYTTSTDEHDGLVSAGWGDSGVVAYVLPLTVG